MVRVHLGPMAETSETLPSECVRLVTVQSDLKDGERVIRLNVGRDALDHESFEISGGVLGRLK